MVLLGLSPAFSFSSSSAFSHVLQFPAHQRSWMYLFIGLYCTLLVTAEILLREGGVIPSPPRQFIVSMYYLNTISILLCAIL